MLERDFQAGLIKELKNKFDGCLVTKLDSSHIQGIPDLLVLNGDKWATLECKRQSNSKRRPNQEYYINKMNDMSFARFVSAENKEEVLNELEVFFQTSSRDERSSCDIQPESERMAKVRRRKDS